MNHLPHLIQDLGLLLILAGITTLLFKRLKQPVVLGYILAGFLVSPNFKLLPTITDIENIRIWADIGVIFLLFTLGLEFSFKKLLRVGGAASITAVIEVSAMLGIGSLIGFALGWPLMDCIFLGGILSIASTTIILRSFDELGVKNKKFAQLVFGILIIEDLVAVVLMVLLSTIAVSRQFNGTDMLFSVLKLTFFLVLWFIAGILFIPSFLSRVQKHLNDETMLIVAVGFCLAMAILASLAGFSPALGAFMMGSILAETTQAERIEHIVKPVKDLFGAVFFVSVGMLIDPAIVKEYALPIILITVVFMFFKTLHVSVGALIAGQPLKTSIYAGMSMGQIGEFSFIIATLGLSLGVTSTFLYPIAVAVSAITTFATPYMIKLAGPYYTKVESILPAKWKKTLTRYSSGTQSMTGASDWQQVLRAFFLHIVLFSIVIMGILVIFARYVQPIISALFTGTTASLVTIFLCLLILSPFLWALVMRKFKSQSFANLWSNKRYRGPLVFLRMIRVGLGLFYVGVMLVSFFSLYVAIGGVVLLLGISLLFVKRIHAFYLRLENRFFSNFNNREIQEAKTNRRELAPWDAHIGQFVLPLKSRCAGMTLEEMAVREQFGVNIAMIKRGDSYTIPAPSRYEKVYPADKILVIGTDEQLEQFKKYIEPEDGIIPDVDNVADVVLKKIVVTEKSFLNNKTIRASGVREKTNGLIVGIERGGRRLLNPESTTVFNARDVIWIVGDPNLIESLHVEL
jgi:monovalent cation:H+ antiporter-2, CPA2 family